jgi:hypothetical protein
MNDGWKKIGRKKRRGRHKRSPAPHKQHRKANVIKDPLKRRKKIDYRQRKAEQEEPASWE